jgi:hypothetical protein
VAELTLEEKRTAEFIAKAPLAYKGQHKAESSKLNVSHVRVVCALRIPVDVPGDCVWASQADRTDHRLI